ncbi:SGNH/GDSL hydrolase family protein [Streptomyces sp. VRA16 Mangrove soil]|uniref:SGNH/GDSL hydrolase family protein n=1 Tax=Streptomyces sp. VRA16 Mangrove soil TaxID=2817434 RepID=UPI001E5357A7|nr:SGNH/GDSL hydrolase family protein [Streptomyces sp. VRA16 Mangrove soil]
MVGLAAPAQATPQPLPYVALGDSYSAASGVLPLDPSAALLCARSTKNYPHVIAERTGATLKDVTCGGAQTKDFAGSQYPGVAPQLDALGADTRLVTLTIGGNDNNTFISTVLSCAAAGVLTAGQGSPCKDHYGSSFADDIDTKTYPAVKAALQAVRNKAPNARVAVLGYPWIMPAKAQTGCFVKMPIASGDVPYVRDIQTHLNSAVQRAANETGATYVDFSQASEGHDACQASGTRWVEPALFGTNFVPVHPNALGESAMAERTMGALGLG